MADVETSLRRLIAELTRERQRLVSSLGRVDADMEDAQRMLERRENGSQLAQVKRTPGVASQPGDAKREALRLMAAGDVWSPARLAAERGTTSQAASNLLKRLLTDGTVEQVGVGEYRVIPSLALSEAQESLPVSGSDDEVDA